MAWLPFQKIMIFKTFLPLTQRKKLDWNTKRYTRNNKRHNISGRRDGENIQG